MEDSPSPNPDPLPEPEPEPEQTSAPAPAVKPAQKSSKVPTNPLTLTGGCLMLFLVAIIFGGFGVATGSVLGAAAAVSGSELGAGSTNQIVIDGKRSAEKKIAVIPIEGLIAEGVGPGPGSVSQVKSALKVIEKDDSVVGVLLVIDTPGGGVTASDRIYHDLMEFKTRSELPVHALFLDVAASGGYYIAMAADHITAHPTTVTGSIGVISQFFNVSEAMDNVGVSVNVVKSLNDKGEVSFKDIGSPYRPMHPEERELLQSLVTEMWERFTEVVATGREDILTLEEVRRLADGRVFTGVQAHRAKLVDLVGYDVDAYREIRKASGHEDAKIVSYRKEPTLRELFGFALTSSLPEMSQVGMARRILSERAGFLYLWTAVGG